MDTLILVKTGVKKKNKKVIRSLNKAIMYKYLKKKLKKIFQKKK